MTAQAEREYYATETDTFQQTRLISNAKVVLVTGSREWATPRVIYNVLRSLPIDYHILIHGDAQGADRMAGKVAEAMGWQVFKFPAPWERYGKLAGPIRNRYMLYLEPNLVLGFHDNIIESKGTKDCFFTALRKGFHARLFNAQGVEYGPSLN